MVKSWLPKVVASKWVIANILNIKFVLRAAATETVPSPRYLWHAEPEPTLALDGVIAPNYSGNKHCKSAANFTAADRGFKAV